MVRPRRMVCGDGDHDCHPDTRDPHVFERLAGSRSRSKLSEFDGLALIPNNRQSGIFWVCAVIPGPGRDLVRAQRGRRHGFVYILLPDLLWHSDGRTHGGGCVRQRNWDEYQRPLTDSADHHPNVDLVLHISKRSLFTPLVPLDRHCLDHHEPDHSPATEPGLDYLLEHLHPDRGVDHRSTFHPGALRADLSLPFRFQTGRKTADKMGGCWFITVGFLDDYLDVSVVVLAKPAPWSAAALVDAFDKRDVVALARSHTLLADDRHTALPPF